MSDLARNLENQRHSISDIVDTDRYPIDHMDSPAGRALVTKCRAQLADSGCVVLPRFVRRDALAAITAETERLAPEAHYNDTRTNPYNSAGDDSLPEDHPKNVFMDRSNGFVAGDRIGPDTCIRRVYHDPNVQRFIAAAMNESAIHEYADPLAGLVINVLRPGCQHPWHYDTNEFIVTMMTKQPEDGGLFQYCPKIRTTESENYDDVAAVLGGDHSLVRTLELQPGDLQIFYGRYSLHRVSRVAGERERHTVIFGYAMEPGVIGRAERTRRIFGRVAPVHLQEAANAPVRSDKLAD